MIEDVCYLLKDKYFDDYQRVSQISGWCSSVANLLSLLPDNSNFQEDVNRLLSGEPLAYVVGYVTFAGCYIDLSLKPLIPRPETEWLLEKIIQDLSEGARTMQSVQTLAPAKTPIYMQVPDKAQHHSSSEIKLQSDSQLSSRILDLGCGSGCIGISLLKNCPRVSVDFVDLEKKFLDQTLINIKKNKLESSEFRLIQSSWFESISDKYDLIVSNPPYVDPAGEYEESLKFEPASALFSKDGGLGDVHQILDQLGGHIRPGGRALIEFGVGQEGRILEMIGKRDTARVEFAESGGANQNLFSGYEVTILKDLYDQPRWISIESPKL